MSDASDASEALNEVGLPADRPPTIAELAALTLDNGSPAMLAVVLAQAIEKLEDAALHEHPTEGDEAAEARLLAVEEMLGMKGEYAARHRLFQVDAFGARVQDIGERLSAVEASMAVPDPTLVEAIDTVATNLQRLVEQVEHDRRNRPSPRETRYAGREVFEDGPVPIPTTDPRHPQYTGSGGTTPMPAAGPGYPRHPEAGGPAPMPSPVDPTYSVEALTRRAEAAEAERDAARGQVETLNAEAQRLRNHLRATDGDLTEAGERIRRLESVIAPDGLAASSSHETTYLLGRIRTLGRTNEKLLRFKILTHTMLNRAGVPEFEQEDCRVAARLEWLVERQVDKDRMLHLVGNLLTYGNVEHGERARRWLVELGLMAGMEEDDEFVLTPEPDLAAARDIADSMSFQPPEMLGEWMPRLRAALGMEG